MCEPMDFVPDDEDQISDAVFFLQEGAEAAKVTHSAINFNEVIWW